MAGNFEKTLKGGMGSTKKVVPINQATAEIKSRRDEDKR